MQNNSKIIKCRIIIIAIKCKSYNKTGHCVTESLILRHTHQIKQEIELFVQVLYKSLVDV